MPRGPSDLGGQAVETSGGIRPELAHDAHDTRVTPMVRARMTCDRIQRVSGGSLRGIEDIADGHHGIPKIDDGHAQPGPGSARVKPNAARRPTDSHPTGPGHRAYDRQHSVLVDHVQATIRQDEPL